jgi:hypothetical protein
VERIAVRLLKNKKSVILSEAKNLSSIAAIKERFFASLRMTNVQFFQPLVLAARARSCRPHRSLIAPQRTLIRALHAESKLCLEIPTRCGNAIAVTL